MTTNFPPTLGLVLAGGLARRMRGHHQCCVGMRFDVPVIGVETVRIAAESGVRVIAVEAGKTLLLERDAIIALANSSNMSVVAR